MNLDEIISLVRSMNIDDDEDDYVFKAAVILLFGLSADTVSVNKIKKGTGFHFKDVDLIIYNFRANGIIQNYQYNLEYLNGTGLEFTIELTLCAMAGSGDIIRKDENGNNFDEDNLPISRAQLIATGRSSANKLMAV